MTSATWLVIFVALVFDSTAASAQTTDLGHIDSLAAAGNLADARIALDRWNVEHPRGDASVGPNDRARALVLAGRLATDWKTAESAFVATALGYPVAPVTPEAILRLGQGLFIARSSPTSNARAISYLERLLTDYPNSSLRPQGLLWLGRAYFAAGRRDAACARIRQAAGIETDTITARLLDVERVRACIR